MTNKNDKKKDVTIRHIRVESHHKLKILAAMMGAAEGRDVTLGEALGRLVDEYFEKRSLHTLMKKAKEALSEDKKEAH